MQYSQKIDNFIVATLFLLCVVVLFELLNIEYQYPFAVGEKVDVGLIKKSRNNVRKKSIDHASWTDVKESTTIFNNDKIFTDSNSKATLEFKSGNELVVSEESLLKISFLNNVFNLDVEKGSFLANFSSDEETFLLLLDGKEFKLKSKKGSIRISDKKVSVISGAATVFSGSEEIILKEGDITDLSDKSLKISKDFPLNLNVDMVKEFYIQPNSPVSLDWQDQEKLEIIYSKDLDFKEQIVKRDIFNKTSLNLDEGLYYLKFKRGEKISSIRQFRVIHEQIPVIESSKQIYFQGQSLRGAIVNETFENYDLFINDIKVASVEDVFSYELKEVGIFQLSARGISDSRNNALKSKTFQIKVIPLPTTGPDILMPDNAQEFYFYGKNTVKVMLKSLFDVDYGLIINDVVYPLLNSEFNFPVTANQTIKIKSFYKIDNHQIESDQREIYVFIDESSDSKDHGKKFILKKPGQEVSFDWVKASETSAPSSYLLEVSRNSNFSNIITKVKTSSESAKLEFQEVGDLYWRVKKIAPDGSVEFSKPEKLILLKPAPPAAPTLKKVILKRITSSNFILRVLDLLIPYAHAASEEEISDKLEWESLEGVEKYQIEIINSQKKIVVNKVLQATSYSLDELKPGNYKYRVASIDFWGQKGEYSQYSELEIKKVNSEIKLLYPLHAKTVEAKKHIFEWRLDKDVQKKKQVFQVEISHDLDFTSSANFQVSGTKIEIDLSIFKGSKVYWRVVDTNDRAIISKRRLLSIKENIVIKNDKNNVSTLENIQPLQGFTFSYLPRKYSAEIDNIKIEGTDLISFGVSYTRKSTIITFQKSSGVVFDDLEFSSDELYVSHFWIYGKLQFGIGTILKYASSYKVTDSEVSEARAFDFGLSLNGVYQINSFSLNASIYLGNEIGFSFKLLKSMKGLKYLTELGFQLQSLKSDDFGDRLIFGPIISY